MSTKRSLAPITTAAALALLFTAAAQAAGKADINFINEAQFADLGRASFDRERALKALDQHLQTLAQQLPEGQSLRVDITDVDLAGELRPWRSDEVRVMRGGIDGPRISLRYTLLAGAGTVNSGEAQLSDLAYLTTTRGLQPGDGELRYEKRLLTQWFKQTFKTH